MHACREIAPLTLALVSSMPIGSRRWYHASGGGVGGGDHGGVGAEGGVSGRSAARGGGWAGDGSGGALGGGERASCGSRGKGSMTWSSWPNTVTHATQISSEAIVLPALCCSGQHRVQTASRRPLRGRGIAVASAPSLGATTARSSIGRLFAGNSALLAYEGFSDGSQVLELRKAVL